MIKDGAGAMSCILPSGCHAVRGRLGGQMRKHKSLFKPPDLAHDEEALCTESTRRLEETHEETLMRLIQLAKTLKKERKK